MTTLQTKQFLQGAVLAVLALVPSITLAANFDATGGSFVGFVLIIIFWGVVNLIASSTGYDTGTAAGVIPNTVGGTLTTT